MKLEDSVCTAEQSMKLKQLSISQEAFHGWVWLGDHKPELCGNPIDGGQQWNDGFWSSNFNDTAAGFTVAELGVMLDSEIYRVGKYAERYSILEKGLPNAFFYAAETMAQAYASLLIFLLENNLVTATDCNNRLNTQ